LISELEAATTHLMAMFAANHDGYTAHPPRNVPPRGRAMDYPEEGDPRVTRHR
jgi:hypothetical protein